MFLCRGGSRGRVQGMCLPPLPERALENRYSARYADMYDRLCILSSSHYVIA